MSNNQSSNSLIASAFSTILEGTALTLHDNTAFGTHSYRIQQSLTNSLEISKFITIGSYARGTAIRGSSDLDLFVVIRRDSVMWGGSPVAPSTLLKRVRDALKTTFPNTSLGRDGAAVVVDFADGLSIDVVPGWFRGMHSGSNWPLYNIPGANDGWLATSPEYHNQYIKNGDAAAGGKLKSVVRILKYWKECRSLPLSAFHMELLLTSHGTCNGAQSLASCVANSLSLLHSRSCRGLQDPIGISGLIQAASTPTKLAQLNSAVPTSATWATSAVLLVLQPHLSQQVDRPASREW